MNISLNIILDSIKHYRYEIYIDLPSDKAFRRISLLPRELGRVHPDCLYVCRLSDAMRAASQTEQLCCLCLRDRIQDERETSEQLSGMIVVNENLELEQLFSEVQDTFVLVDDWYEQMQDAIIQRKSMQDIITMSEPVIGNFISVSDSALSLIAYTKNVSTDDPTSLFLIRNGYHSEETIRRFKKFKRFDTWMNSDGPIVSEDGNISRYVIISRVFAYNETYFTHVVMTCNHREKTPGLLDLFYLLTNALSFYIKQNWEVEKNFKHVYTSLVVDLMERKIRDEDSVKERARIVGIRPDDQYVIMLLTMGGRGNSVFPGHLAQDIAQLFSRIKPVYYNCRMMLFLHYPDIARLMSQQGMEEKLDLYFKENNICCGISEVFTDLLELPEAYRQAEMTLSESGTHFRNENMVWEAKPNRSSIVSFHTYYSSCLLDKSEQNETLWRSSKYGKMLLELYKSDLEKNTNNLEVLHTFLFNERRATETAYLLHMHRNNVVYRISRIEELLQISLDDRLTRLNLTMSFLMLKRTGVLQEPKTEAEQEAKN